MNSQSRTVEFNRDIDAQIESLSEEALKYAAAEFGVGHPIWRSIHDQLASCTCPHSCDEHDQLSADSAVAH